MIKILFYLSLTLQMGAGRNKRNNRKDTCEPWRPILAPTHRDPPQPDRWICLQRPGKTHRSGAAE